MLINKEPQLLLVSWHDGQIPQVSPLVTRFLFSGTTYHSDKSAGSGCCSTGDSYPLIQAALTKERYIFTDCPINRQTFNESNLKKLVSVYILYIVHVYTQCDQDTHKKNLGPIFFRQWVSQSFSSCCKVLFSFLKMDMYKMVHNLWFVITRKHPYVIMHILITCSTGPSPIHSADILLSVIKYTCSDYMASGCKHPHPHPEKKEREKVKI